MKVMRGVESGSRPREREEVAQNEMEREDAKGGRLWRSESSTNSDNSVDSILNDLLGDLLEPQGRIDSRELFGSRGQWQRVQQRSGLNNFRRDESKLRRMSSSRF